MTAALPPPSEPVMSNPMPAQTTRELKAAIRLIESLVLDEYHRLGPLVNARLDTPMIVGARKQKARIDKAWTLLKQRLEQTTEV